MKHIKTIVCVVLCLLLLLSAAGCDRGGGYRVIDTYSAEGSYVIAFREGDRLCELVTATLGELAANGTLRGASNSWFGENLIAAKSDEGAMNELWERVEPRTVTVGVDITNMPMSYESADGAYKGFDVDLANYICGYLGMSMVIYPIDMADVDVELKSGNIDMAMGIPSNDEKNGFDYSPAYLNSRYVLVAAVSGGVGGRNALRGKNLGVVITDVDVLQQDEKFVEKLGSVTYQTNTDGLFIALRDGEVDGILVSSVVAAYYMK